MHLVFRDQRDGQTSGRDRVSAALKQPGSGQHVSEHFSAEPEMRGSGQNYPLDATPTLCPWASAITPKLVPGTCWAG